MRILDLFCGAGGAAMGYHRAFPDAKITGVDINPQPNYPFELLIGDALNQDRLLRWNRWDLIHASPPCHDHSTVTGRDRKANGHKGTGWMLEATVNRLREVGVPWVVENVEGAKMPSTVFEFRLCGSSFGLDVRRHRKFVSNMLVFPPPCDHGWQTPRFRSLNLEQHREGTLASVVGVHGNCNYAGEFEIRCRAMGIDWMTNAELTQAIPPAYTEWIGQQFAPACQQRNTA